MYKIHLPLHSTNSQLFCYKPLSSVRAVANVRIIGQCPEHWNHS